MTVREALEEAVHLFESYGLVANTFDAGRWVNDARDALASPPEQPVQYMANCLRAGACHGKCESTACTNFHKMIVARRCVEDIPPGTVMPKETM